jgi:hypothetical protein
MIKDNLVPVHKDVWECGGIASTFLISTLHGSERSNLCPGLLSRELFHVIHRTGGCLSQILSAHC